MVTPGGFAALFPGQGSQQVGMGKSLFQEFSIARQVFEEACDALHVDLKKLCFDGPENDLTLTENTQPCLLTVSVAAFRVAEAELEFRPALVMGHSLGEYSALVAAGALNLSTAVRWVRSRGLAMQSSVPLGEGTMAALLGLEDESVEKLCKKATEGALEKRKSWAINAPELQVEAIVQPANFNAPGQLVIAGSTDAVAEAITLVKTDSEFKGGKAIPLSVSAPFHCKLMAPARLQMSEIFLNANSSEKPTILLCPYIPNRTARVTQEPGVILDLLIEQIDHPVLWKQSMQALFRTAIQSGVEFGPGKILQGLAKRVAQASNAPFSSLGISDSASLNLFETELKKKEVKAS